jgi:hypothetical protein
MPIEVRYTADPRLRSSGLLPTGRTVVGRISSPPELFWLENDSATVLDFLAHQADGTTVEDCFFAVRALWDADEEQARKRWTTACVELVDNQLIVPAS